MSLIIQPLVNIDVVISIRDKHVAGALMFSTLVNEMAPQHLARRHST